MIIALWAALAMVAQDIFGALLTQAEARDMAWRAGWLDTAGWLVALASLKWSLNAVNGHDLALKIVVVGAVSFANLFGSYLGTKLGKRWLKDKTIAARLSTIENRLGIKND